jgi:hypothetical protein
MYLGGEPGFGKAVGHDAECFTMVAKEPLACVARSQIRVC